MLPGLTQVTVVSTLLKKMRHCQLRNGRGGQVHKIFVLAGAGHVAPRDHPAQPKTRRHGLGKRTAENNVVGAVEGFGRPRALTRVIEITVYIILNQWHIGRRQHGYQLLDRKSTRLNSSHVRISYAVFCLKKKRSKDIEHLVERRLGQLERVAEQKELVEWRQEWHEVRAHGVDAA